MSKSPDARYQSATAMLEALTPRRGGLRRASPQTGARSAAGPSGEEAAATEVVPVQAPAGGALATRGSSRRRAAFIGVAALVLSVIGVFVVSGLSRPALVVENALVEPIRLTVNGVDEQDVGPGEQVSVRIPRGRPLLAHWAVQAPRSPGGATMGVTVSGTIIEADPRRTVRRQATSWPADTAYFAPLITNRTDQPLTVIVNAGLAGAMRCECWVPPGATRAHIGYYLLFENSNVEVADPSGRVATFRDLGSDVDRRSGVVGLRFETADLREPSGEGR